MSMDEVFERARIAERALVTFNDRMRASFLEITAAHEHVAPLWIDTMRRDYDQAWQPEADGIRNYIDRVGPAHVENLSTKLHHLQLYLHGN